MSSSVPRLQFALTRTTMPILLWTVLSFFATATARANELVIVEDGKSAYRIVVAVDASVQDYYAAQILQRYVKDMTGAELPIVTDDNALGDAEIVVGFNRHAARLAPELKPEGFGPEEFLVKTFDRRLVIVGGSPRGVLYGVIDLLTEEWGCRWFAPSLRRIPKRPRLTLDTIDRRYQPPFEYREAYFWSALDNEWTVQNRQHGQFAKQTLAQGGRAGYAWFVHTAMRLVPPDRYLKDHPEYFWTEPRKMLNVGSKGTGICLTNPDVAKIAAQSILDSHRQHPAGDLLYSISSGDSNDWCECPGCMKQYEQIGQVHGEVGGESVKAYPFGVAWLRFAGKVASILESVPAGDRPRIGMLAYGYSPLPPTKPEPFPDVNVMYAELNACQFHALDDPDCTRNADYRQRLRGWLASAGSTYVWLYKLNFGGEWFWIHPNLDTFARDMRYLRSVGVKGVFVEGTLYAGQQWDGELHELRAYLLARLMWDPDLDWRELRREFCAAYYGQAAGAVMERYMDDVRACVVESGTHCRAEISTDGYAWVTPEMIARWYSILDEAESKADDEHKRPVRISRLHVQFTEAKLTKDPAEQKTLLRKFADDAKSSGVIYIGMAPRFLSKWRTEQGLD